MVGSELPSPADDRVHRHRRRRAASSSDLALTGAGGPRRLLRRRHLHHPPRRGARHRRRRGQRPGRAGRGAHGHAARPTSGRGAARRARTSPAGPPGAAARPASASSPRTGTGTGCCSRPPLWENRILGHQTQAPNVERRPLIDRRGARGRHRADRARVRRAHAVASTSLASALSGGNQQKLIVGREMSGDPTVLLAAHPTRGVDVGAQAAIWDLLRAARAQGLAVLLISADLDELIGLSDSAPGDPARPPGRRGRPARPSPPSSSARP